MFKKSCVSVKYKIFNFPQRIKIVDIVHMVCPSDWACSSTNHRMLQVSWFLNETVTVVCFQDDTNGSPLKFDNSPQWDSNESIQNENIPKLGGIYLNVVAIT